MIEDITNYPDRYVNNVNENMRRNGERVWIAWTNKPVFDENGKTIGMLCIGNDITERRRAEESLQESERRYRALIETTNTGYVIIDGEGRVLDANAEYVRLTGERELADIRGRSVVEWTADEQKERNGEAVRECLDEGFIRNLEIGYRGSLGNLIPIEINATVVEKEGQKQILTLCRDISDRQRAENERLLLQERLQRAEKMEALGMLAGGVAHDLNNVLGILVGYSELLLCDIPEKSALRGHAEKILGGGARAAAIVQDLLTLARRGVHSENVINLNTLIGDIQKTPEFENLCSSHPGVRFQTELAPDLLSIKGSASHLYKTVMNLLTNAAEAIPEGGTVTVTTGNRNLDRPVQGYDNVRAGDYAVLSVSDTGNGIAGDDMRHIFEPFYTKKVMGRSGTGLGLAVVWGTVKDHQAYIDVQSEPGKGATFTLYFPVTREALTTTPTAIPVEEYFGNDESILVVDDIREQRELAASMLGKLNYKVETAACGEAAVEVLKGRRVDLVVLDMIMDPGMDGLDTYRKIIETHPRQKAIIVSGFSETDRVLEAQSLGAGSYVRKPYIMEKLGLTVREELDRK